MYFYLLTIRFGNRYFQISCGLSILKGNEQIFATKYKLYLPTEEQLRQEIEKQKELFMLQHGGNSNV